MFPVAVITINRNMATGLEKTLESVVSQTFQDFEYIVIDGASTDNSLEVIDKYKHRINYIVSEPDTGIYNAMNKAIKKAGAEFCMFLNSGDYFHDNDVLKDIQTFLGDADIIYGNILKKDGKREFEDKGIGKSDVSLYDLYLGTINHCSSFIRKKLFEEYGYYQEDYRVVSDWLFFLKSVGLGKASVKYVDRLISVFILDGISQSEKDYFQTERIPALRKTIPKAILSDYDRFYQDIELLNRIRKRTFGRLLLKIARKISS